MTQKKKFPRLDLQLFADGAGTGGDGTASGSTGVIGTDAASQAGVTPMAAASDGRKNPQQEGKAPAAGESKTESDDRSAAFEKLIQGEYKDLYDARVQKMLRGRLKETQATVERYEALTPVLEALADKYGVDISDSKALKAAIDKDDAYYEAEAAEKGVTVEQLKELRKVQRENSTMKRRMAEQARKAQYDAWMTQAEQAKAVYPSLDLREEIKNPQFLSLLRNNIDVKTAYQVIHQDEILPAAMQVAARKAEEQVTSSIIAGASRPAENGIGSQSAAASGIDVSKMSRAERQEINRRVARGEKIDFTKR